MLSPSSKVKVKKGRGKKGRGGNKTDPLISMEEKKGKSKSAIPFSPGV